MAYIGRQLARGENKLFDDISSSFNGSTTTFTLAVSSVATATATPYQLFVSLGGVMQKPNTDFTTAGNQITFTTAPAAGLSCWIMMQGDTIDNAAIADSSVTPSKISGTNFAFSGDLRLKDADGSHYVGFASPTTVASNKVWTLPAADGSASQYLQTNGSGVLSWATVSIGGGTGIDFNDNVKARWGTGNDLEIFHNGSNSVINDAGTGDLLLQVGGSTKATVSSTGLAVTGALTVSTNATITGDLTVSGTTTTINTQTLDVEDKNVVIGKVSSPSDTTADGGGWTLKGATDKTFNWVNATDAWTSSEHIHLIDNKKLFVGGASGTTDGLEIVHNASDSILNDTGTGTLKLQLGGSTKLEITSGGIDVTGAITVGGSPLSSAPTVDLVADGAIGNNVACNIKSNGKVEAITQIAAGSNASPSANSFNNYDTYSFDTTSNVLIHWWQNSGDSYLKCQIGTLTGADNTSDISWGSALTVTASAGATHMNAYYDSRSDRHFIGYRRSGQWYAKAVTINSNGTITAGSEFTWGAYLDYQLQVSGTYDATSQILIVWRDDNHDNLRGRNLTINPTDNSIAYNGNMQNVISGRDWVTPFFSLTYKGDRFTCLARTTESGNTTVKLMTQKSGSFGSQLNIGGTNTSNFRPHAVYDADADRLIIFYQRGTDIFYRICTPTNSNPYLTIGSEQTFRQTVDQAFMIRPIIAYDTVNKTYHLLWAANNSYASNNKTILTPFTIASGASSLTIGTDKLLDAATNLAGAFYDASKGNVIAAVRTPKAYTSYPVTTTVTTENFLGYSSAAYSDGNTATIKTTGNTVTGLSGLTPGKTYYMQRDGSLSLTAVPARSMIAGTALTSSSLLINPGR